MIFFSLEIYNERDKNQLFKYYNSSEDDSDKSVSENNGSKFNQPLDLSEINHLNNFTQNQNKP